MGKQREIYDFIAGNLNPSQPFDFDPAVNLLEGGILDSVAMMEVIVWLEENYKIVIDTDDLTPENFSTLDAIAAHLDKMLASA